MRTYFILYRHCTLSTDKEKNVENIFIEMDKNETLTCVTKEPASDFQWFKVIQNISSIKALTVHEFKESLSLQFRISNLSV